MFNHQKQPNLWIDYRLIKPKRKWKYLISNSYKAFYKRMDYNESYWDILLKTIDIFWWDEFGDSLEENKTKIKLNLNFKK